jgi:hypothetical protein
MTTSPATKPGPSRKAIIGWTVAMFVVLGLTWFVCAVVLPLRKTHAVLSRGRRLAKRNILWNHVRALNELGGDDAAVPLLDLYLRCPRRMAPCRREAMQLLRYCGDEGLHVLFGVATRGTESDRHMVVWVGWFYGRPSCGPLLAEALRDKNPRARAAAAYIIGEADDLSGRFTRSLTTALADESPEVRAEAATALGKCFEDFESLKDEDLLRGLGAALRDKEPLVRKAAAAAFGHIKADRGLEPLKRARNDPDPEVRVAVEDAIKKTSEYSNPFRPRTPPGYTRQRSVSRWGTVKPSDKERSPAQTEEEQAE